MPADAGRRWSTPQDVRSALRRRWDRGEFLAMIAREASWEPIAVPIRAPTAAELAQDFGAGQEWVRQWRAADPGLIRLEYKNVGGRLIGSNRLPCRAWIDSPEALWKLLRVTGQVATFTELLNSTSAESEALAAWVAEHPMKALAHADQWRKLVQTTEWIQRRAGPQVFLRQVDVPGVDTKFIEKHRGILAELLDALLPEHRINREHPPSSFAERYGLRSKPGYIRVRSLGSALLGPYSELTLRTDELAAEPLGATTVYVMENEITYLAFPPVPAAIAIWGGGYALPRLRQLSWLHERQLVYWGDIDTHGFVILNRLREAFPHTRSLLMDRDTLLGHREQWVREDSPTATSLPQLTVAEAALYTDLVDNVHGPAVRLEQERVGYRAIVAALACE